MNWSDARADAERKARGEPKVVYSTPTRRIQSRLNIALAFAAAGILVASPPVRKQTKEDIDAMFRK